MQIQDQLSLIAAWLQVRIACLETDEADGNLRRGLDDTLSTVQVLAARAYCFEDDESPPPQDWLEEAQALVAKLSEVDQDEVRAILEDGFRRVVVPRYSAVCTLGPLDGNRLLSPEEQQVRATEYGFRFEPFGQLLLAIGFWERVGPELERLILIPSDRDWSSYVLSLDDVDFEILLAALNGNSFRSVSCSQELYLDYEKLFPEAEYLFKLIRKYKFLADDDYTSCPSMLNMPDILFCILLERLNRGMPEAKQIEVARCTAKIFGSQVDNTARILAYRMLSEIYGSYQDFDDEQFRLIKVLKEANDALLLPLGHRGRFDLDLTDEGYAQDVVIGLTAGDCGSTAQMARATLIFGMTEAFFLPIGDSSSHDQPTGEGSSLVLCSEAEEMEAIALFDDRTTRAPDTRYADLPHALPMGMVDPLPPWRILPGDRVPTDPPTNAGVALARLTALSRALGQPLSVCILTTSQHAARAWAEFRQVLSEELVPSLTVMTNPGPFHIDFAKDRSPFLIANLFCEYLERLRLVSMS